MADAAPNPGQTGGDVSPVWRREEPAVVPGEVTATPRRKVFLWLLGFLLICAASISVLTWLRPYPKPYFAPIWISETQNRPFDTTPYSKQDHAALIAGDYFAKGRIQLKAISASLPSDTIVIYIASHALCDKKGRVLLLPMDADPITPQAFRPLETVLKTLAASPAQKKLLILDIAWPVEDPYWGRLDVGAAARIPDELAAVPDPARLVLCSCSPGQVPLAAPELRRSVFGYFLEEGLRGWADVDESNPERQGLVMVKQLANYVQARVKHWTRLHGDPPQTPILYGEAADFPLVALAKGKPITHQERADAEKYPDWLTGAWKARDQWRAEERHRLAPWLFRQVEDAVLHADRNWQYGADGVVLKKQWQSELERLDKYYQRISVPAKPETLSVAASFTAGKPPAPVWVAATRDLFKKVRATRAAAVKVEEGEKAVEKLVEEFILAGKQIPDADWTAAVMETLVVDPFPRREAILLAERLLALRQEGMKYAEAEGVRRLARLAETFDEPGWPVALVRKAILLMHGGEKAAGRVQSFPWFARVLEQAAQKRFDAETLLFARGYVRLGAVEMPLTEALREYEAVLAKQDIMEDALRQMHDALAQMPGYAACLDFFPTADPIWQDAVRAAQALQGLLKPPTGMAGLAPAQLNPLIEDVRIKAESLRGTMRQLKQMHAADVVDDLLARSKAPDADVQTYHALMAQWSVPFQPPETRVKIWNTLNALGGKLAEIILEDDTVHATSAQAPDDDARDLQDARTIATRRAARSLALLRLAGLDGVHLDKLEQDWEAFARARPAAAGDAPVEERDGHVLAQGLRQAWAQALPQQTMAQADVRLYERVSRVAPEWIRLGAKEELLAKAAALIEQESERALWAWLADRYRYASQEPEASPFLRRAAFAVRTFAPDDVIGFAVPATATVAALTPKKSRLLLKIPLRWQALPKEPATLTFQLFGVNEDWLQINPDLAALGKLTALPAGEGGVIELPLEVTLKPQAELSAAPRPNGFLFGLRLAGRTYFHKVDLPLLPSAGRLEIVVSADPKEPGIPLGDLRLRPSKERQSFYVYVNNLDDKVRNLIVELHANNRVPLGGAVGMIVPPKQTARVVFGTPGTVKEVPPAVALDSETAVLIKPREELPVLTGPVQIRVLDKDRPQDVLAVREIRIDVAQPREYVRVPAIRFEPASEANKGRNRLDVTVQAARKLDGPPCLVELVIPLDRIPGLKTIRAAVFRGELPMNGEPLKLSVADLEFEPAENDTGFVYLTVDGIERAFIFRTTFAPVGEPTSPREELRPAVRLNAGLYYRTNTKFEAVTEVDNAPADAQLLVSLGRLRGGTFEPDIRHAPLTPRQKRIGFAIRQSDGGIEFDALVRDWRVPFAAVPVRGERAVQARLIDATGTDLLPPVYHRVLFDDHVPERVEFINLPRQAKRDLAYRLKATGVDTGIGLRDVFFYLAAPGDDGKFPPNTPRFEAKPLPGEPGIWAAIINWPLERKGPLDVAVQFTNKLGLSATTKGTVELVDYDPEKSALGTIEGVAREGPRPQTGVLVVLQDVKGNKLAEQKTKEGGTFAFTNLPAGKYVVVASKPTSSRPITATSKVDLAPGKTVRLKMDLFL